MHPQNSPMRTLVLIGSLLTFCALVTAYASAVFATASEGVMEEFGFGKEVAALGTPLYVLGFSAGPSVWAPASEAIGRRWPLLVGISGFDIFTIACATAKDTQTVMLTRFFSGFCAASVIALVPASLSDLFNNHHRGIAIAVYTMSVFTGPFTAPFIGGFAAESYLGWRWTLYGDICAHRSETESPPSCALSGGYPLALFGWTGWNPSVHWMAPTAAGVVVGFGITSIFMQGFNYLLGSYLDFAASAFAANMMMRSMVGACFPLFPRHMFNNPGIQWAGTLLGCIAVLMIPIPVLFLVFGPRLRQRSRLAPGVGIKRA
ncbi:hypothetical protein BBP40_012386 [Aspergillus hancockii]|nr:hypothetical protein BBP40_012386 [Aspergillus hancockii]